MTTILIVEDEETVLETLAYNLRQEGYKVLTAEDGEQAIEIIRRKKPDLVVLDIMLPRLDGLAVCRIVRKDPQVASTPIIMLTARGTQSDKMIGLDSGADDYVTKPFELGEFLARVRAVLRRAPGRAVTSQVLTGGDITVDLAARRAYRGKQELQLSQKEFDLLAELMRNQGAVLSRDLILTRVWGYDYYGDSRTVDVHIRWLREKIEDDPSHPTHIITVRGVGYRFEG
ncbi:MAG TPA: response regulator transcription factor [Chloroflexi bacterium]|nr:response regulator transcription factor [Chloroflexota bacterium]